MNKLKKNMGIILLTIALVTIAVVAGVFSNTSTTNNSEEIEISVILPDSENTSWKTFKTGMHAAAKEYGISLKIIKVEQLQSNHQLEEAITQAVEEGTNGIITEFSNEEASDILSSTIRKVPVVLTKPISKQTETNSSLGIMNVDTSTIANTLALQLSKNHKSDSINIGVIAKDEDSLFTQEILETLKQELISYDFNIAWNISGDDLSISTIKYNQSKTPVNKIVALDSYALEIACDYKNDNPNDSIDLYGIGTSDKCIYNTDLEVINSLIIPDNYYSGYMAVSNLYSKIKNNTALSTYNVNYRIISHANLYTSTNQKLLFPIGN